MPFSKEETAILQLLETKTRAQSIPQIIQGIKNQNPKLREREIRPAIYSLAASHHITLNPHFRAKKLTKITLQRKTVQPDDH